MKTFSCILLSVLCVGALYAQDSVDVTFRYAHASSPTIYVAGEFNSWSTSAAPMTYDGSSTWQRTVRLSLSGGSYIPGTYSYKYYYSGASTWPNDAIDHHLDAARNNNSYIYTKDPTIYQLQPNSRQSTVSSARPTISAYVFPKVGATIDTSSMTATLDGATYSIAGTAYSDSTKKISWTTPIPVTNGSHTVILSVSSSAGSTNADTVTFTAQSGYVQITTHGGYSTWNKLRTIRGVVQDTSIHSLKLVRNGVDTISVTVSAGSYSTTDTLEEGVNSYQALADSAGSVAKSDVVSFTYLVSHAPVGAIAFTDGGSTLEISAAGSTDPDTAQVSSLTYLWTEDTANPQTIGGITGSTSKTLTVVKPATAGEYYVDLVVTDPDGNADTTRNYIIVNKDGSTTIPTYKSNPAWAKAGRIYFLFPKAASTAGTIAECTTKLEYIQKMGFTIIWVMPVMKNATAINLDSGPGYNIVDFYNVASEYGTNADFKEFVTEAHALGLKVILDVTPNHSSYMHPWSVDAHAYLEDSRYWEWYEHNEITSNTNSLGDCLDDNGFNYYCGFSSQLLNLNWSNIDMRTEMINIYRYWIKEFGLDGFRFDVYWGPHRRYGEQYMGIPVRTALKHIKPDILLLGEDDGTGTGTETIYADYTGTTPGGLDASYDFKLYFNRIENFTFGSSTAITNLHNEILDGSFYPGPDALYMRFMESQDEDRIVYFYSNDFAIDSLTTFHRTMPMASVLFTIPGLPMIWNGQEIGWGYGITTSTHARNRSIINWTYAGREVLTPHYQKLAWIRGEFPAFTAHKQDTDGDGSVTSADSSDFNRVTSSNSLLYAFVRPYTDQNGVTAVNFSSSSITATLDLSSCGLKFSASPSTVYVNNLYSGTSESVSTSTLSSYPVTLDAYGSAIYTVSTTLDTLSVPTLSTSVETKTTTTPYEFALAQNYPNPFNPSTTITFRLATAGQTSLVVYDLLGRRVASLVDGHMSAGDHSVVFNAARFASGMYFYRLESEGNVAVKKMLLVK